MHWVAGLLGTAIILLFVVFAIGEGPPAALLLNPQTLSGRLGVSAVFPARSVGTYGLADASPGAARTSLAMAEVINVEAGIGYERDTQRATTARSL
jgi:hypothetical protein